MVGNDYVWGEGWFINNLFAPNPRRSCFPKQVTIVTRFLKLYAPTLTFVADDHNLNQTTALDFIHFVTNRLFLAFTQTYSCFHAKTWVSDTAPKLSCDFSSLSDMCRHYSFPQATATLPTQKIAALRIPQPAKSFILVDGSSIWKAPWLNGTNWIQ